MLRFRSMGLIAAFWSFAAPAASLFAAVITPPIGLPSGQQYQLVFASADLNDASSTDIADYNKFVTDQAAENSDLPAATWTAILSTANINASANAPNLDLPVYNTLGELVATANNLYSGTLTNSIYTDQFGGTPNTQAIPWVWTGSSALGGSLNPVGNEGGTIGDRTSATGTWLNNGDAPALFLPHDGSIYALSSPITKVPEPQTVVMALTALATLGGARLLKRRARS